MTYEETFGPARAADLVRRVATVSCTTLKPAVLTHFTTLSHISPRPILISSSHLLLGLSNVLFPSGVFTRLCISCIPVNTTCPAHLTKLYNKMRITQALPSEVRLRLQCCSHVGTLIRAPPRQLRKRGARWNPVTGTTLPWKSEQEFEGRGWGEVGRQNRSNQEPTEHAALHFNAITPLSTHRI